MDPWIWIRIRTKLSRIHNTDFLDTKDFFFPWKFPPPSTKFGVKDCGREEIVEFLGKYCTNSSEKLEETHPHRDYWIIYRGPGLSCNRMIRLLAHPLPPSPISNLSLFLSLPVCRWSSLLAGEEGRGRARSRTIQPRKSLALYTFLHLPLPLFLFWEL